MNLQLLFEMFMISLVVAVTMGSLIVLFELWYRRSVKREGGKDG